MNANQRRLLTLQAIARNSTGIVITRYPMIDDGAGGEYPDTQNLQILPVQNVRIFMSSFSEAQNRTNEGGQIQVQRWGLLAKWDADIKKNDIFAVKDQTFRVFDVNPVRYAGEVVSLQVDIEEVS